MLDSKLMEFIEPWLKIELESAFFHIPTVTTTRKEDKVIALVTFGRRKFGCAVEIDPKIEFEALGSLIKGTVDKLQYEVFKYLKEIESQ